MGHAGTVRTTVLTKVSDLSVVFVQEKQNCGYLALNLRGTTKKTIQQLLEDILLARGKNNLCGLTTHLNQINSNYFILLHLFG